MTIRLPKLRESAKQAPHCMSCMRPNPDGNLLCLAHSNVSSSGRGFSFKSAEQCGAILCDSCHKWHDAGTSAEQEKMEMFLHAHNRTLIWWVEEGFLK